MGLFDRLFGPARDNEERAKFLADITKVPEHRIKADEAGAAFLEAVQKSRVVEEDRTAPQAEMDDKVFPHQDVIRDFNVDPREFRVTVFLDDGDGKQVSRTVRGKAEVDRLIRQCVQNGVSYTEDGVTHTVAARRVHKVTYRELLGPCTSTPDAPLCPVLVMAEYLNNAIKVNRELVDRLIETRVDTDNAPDDQLPKFVYVVRDGQTQVGLLGVLNGFAALYGKKMVAVTRDEEPNSLLYVEVHPKSDGV